MTTTSKSKKPSKWKVWQHKTQGWYTYDLSWTLAPKYNWKIKMHESSPHTAEDFVEIDPHEHTFKADLKFRGIATGRSAVNFSFEDLKTGESFVMLLREFEDIMKRVTFNNGHISGIWRFEKCGTSIGICLVKELLDETPST